MTSRRKQVTYSAHPNRAARSAHAKGDRQFRTYDTSYIRPKKNASAAIVALVIMLAAIVVVTVLLSRACTPAKVELLGEGQEARIEIASGDTATAIGGLLADAHLVSSAQEFIDLVNSKDAAASLIPGTYVFEGGTSAEDILDRLLAGPVAIGDTLVIPEGFTLDDIGARVEEATSGRITAQQMAQATSDADRYAARYSFLDGAGAHSLEGFLFPKTYTVTEDMAAEDVVVMMLDQFQDETAALDWSYPSEQGLDIYEAVILASIVEKESSADMEVRSKVASVFYNRLGNFGEPNYGYLQSDATTAYEVGHDPSADEVHADSTYSTYTHQGLPPTPICSPGLECLSAVCNPDQDALDTYYFFYFDEEGNYSFSRTYEEHIESFS